MLDSKNIVIEGLKINYITGGKGSPLLVLPGWPGNLETSDNFLIKLSKNFTVIGINWPGFGLSDGFSYKAEMKNFTNLLQKFLEKFKISNVNILSFSFGATVAIAFADKYPEFIKSMVITAPVVNYSLFPIHLKSSLLIVPYLFPLIRFFINNNYIFDKLYYFVTRYDQDNANSIKDKDYNRKNLLNMNFKDCFNTISILKDVNFMNNIQDIKPKTLMLVGEKDSFVGETPELIKSKFNNIQLIKLPVEHYQILSTYSVEKITHFFK